jgi:hypothetical protein
MARPSINRQAYFKHNILKKWQDGLVFNFVTAEALLVDERPMGQEEAETAHLSTLDTKPKPLSGSPRQYMRMLQTKHGWDGIKGQQGWTERVTKRCDNKAHVR